MKYKITLISSDGNTLEEEATTNARIHIEKLQWEHFGYQVKYIDTIDSIEEL